MSEKIEKSFNVGILGENHEINTLLGQAFGAPGTKSDLQFFNRLDENLGYIFCAVTPLDYPEKIKPMLQTLSLTDIYILAIDLNIGLNSVVGELLVAIDIFHRIYKKKIIITLNNIKNNTWKLEEIKKKINKILESINFSPLDIIVIDKKDDYELLKKKVVQLGLELFDNHFEEFNHKYTKLFIDHVFPVKGIGTVALSLVKEGILKKGQMLEIVGFNGSSKKVIIKNIQKQDRNFNIAYKNDRIGLALKNIKVNEIGRENLLATPEIFKKEIEIEAEVFISEFYKPKGGKLEPGNNIQFFAMANLNLSPFKFLEGKHLYPGKYGEVKIRLEKPLYHDGNGLEGIITELNKFENKLRIVGHLKQIK